MKILVQDRALGAVATDWFAIPFLLTKESYTFPLPRNGKVVAAEGATQQRSFFVTFELPTKDMTVTLPKEILRKLLENNATRVRFWIADEVVRKKSFAVTVVSEEEVEVHWVVEVEGGFFSDKTTKKSFWLSPGQAETFLVEADQGLVFLKAYVVATRT